MNWHIVDWMNNTCFDDKRFDSFEEARDFISEYADKQAFEEYPEDEAKQEEVYNGICEDLYAEEVAE